jgi:hypothetical protein
MKPGDLCRTLMGPLALYTEPPIGEASNSKQLGVLEGNQTCLVLDIHPRKCYLGFNLAKIITPHGNVCWIRTGGLKVVE